jgi:solute:Na+ symporter, SSS family
MRKLFLVFIGAILLPAGEWPRTLVAVPGRTPVIDGHLTAGEWKDATEFDGVAGWTPQFSPTTDAKDLSLRGWVKHDGEQLYFAFDITDDVLYGIDTPRWLPDNNTKAHQLTREGWPWFGDEMEILLNAAYAWKGNESVEANGRSWQMVCNLTKSRLGGVGKGGLLEGEPRSRMEAWDTYQRWIREGAMRAAVSVKPGGKGYFLEWAIRFRPCVEVEPGRFWSPAMGDRKVGLNIALGDLDEKERGAGNFGNFHHEDWWTGEKDRRTWLRQFGTLVLRAR